MADDEFVSSVDPKIKLTPKERARNARMRARLQGRQRVEVMLAEEAAIALLFLRRRAGQSAKAIIEALLLAERERVLRR